jgi:GTP-binding protein EngB required for normal cell division
MTTLRSPRDVRKNDKIIAIMGPTGSGKSNLIDTLSRSTKWSGNSLLSETQKVSAVRVKLSLQGSTEEIVLVDTPGFNDTTRSDLEILRLIADWLKQTYERGIKLTGILYLHRISDNRMPGTPLRNLRMLGKLCGTEPAKRVIFVTTMWDKISPDRGTGRETDLKSHYFKPMLDLGAVAARFTNTHESACGIISRLFMLLEEQKVTLIQEEMVMIQRELAETKAAEEVLTDLQKLLRDHKQTIEALKREAERADNQQMIASLNKELADIQQRMEKTFREVQKLKIPFSRRIRRLFASKPKQKTVDMAIS